MSYIQAKQTFEAVLQKMQDDLQAYTASKKANQRAVNIRMDMLNKLVDFYQAAEEQISDLEMELMGFQLAHSDLHQTTQKLVYWCKLHGVNVMQPLLYSNEELEQMIIRGRKFRIIPGESLEEKFDTVAALHSKNYEEYMADDHKYFDTLFHAETNFRYITKL